jgi:hypothetical protein
MNEDSYWDPPAEAYKRPSKVTCEDCSADRDYYVMMQYRPGSLGKSGYYKCTVCKREIYPLYLGGELKMAAPVEYSEGNYAIIRSHSGSGHSPSRRFKTAKIATAAAVKLAEENFTLEFEVVKIVARVSCLPKATVTRVR